MKPPVTDSLLLSGSKEGDMLTAPFKSCWRPNLWLQGEFMWIVIIKTCPVHFSDKQLSTLSRRPVVLTQKWRQLSTPERCDNYRPWCRSRHERQAQSGASGWIVIVRACRVHFSDKPLINLSQRTVALTTTLCNHFAPMASPWSHQSLIHCFSVAARKGTC